MWCCVSFLVLAGNSFWCYVRTKCTIQLCGCVIVFVVAGKFVILTGEKKSSSRLSGGCAIVITTGKKSSSRDRYYDQKKKVLDSCGVVLYFLTLAGNSFWCYVRTKCTIQLCCCVSFFVVARKFYYDREKKSSCRLSDGCAIVITTGKKRF